MQTPRSERVERLRWRLERRALQRVARLKKMGMMALAMWLSALAWLAVPNVGELLYALAPGQTAALAAKLGGPVDVDRSAFGDILYERPDVAVLPPKDPSLPKENRLIIEKVGLDTPILEGEDWEEILKNGVWMMPGLGEPGDLSQPTFLAAHRIGYLRWSNEFRRESSFYNLPKVENGDIVKVIWNQRVFEYEIFEGYTSGKVENYNADLVLYTCEFLNSDQRILRSARLLRVVGADDSATESEFGGAEPERVGRKA